MRVTGSHTTASALICVILASCSRHPTAPSGAVLAPLVPAIGSTHAVPMSCDGSYPLPPELLGPEGLGRWGWTLDDLKLRAAWDRPSVFVSPWLSDNSDARPSLRVRPWLVPEAGVCFEKAMARAAADASTKAIVAIAAAFRPRDVAYDALAEQVYDRADYDESGDTLTRALRGLHDLPNDWSGAPVPPPWTEATRATIASTTANYPQAMKHALARLVLAVGEATLLREQALARVDHALVERLVAETETARYTTYANATQGALHGQGIMKDMMAAAPSIDVDAMSLAAQVVVQAVDELRSALRDVPPFASPRLDVATPHGRVVVSTTATDDDYAAGSLADAAIVIDLGGNDRYRGRYASTHRPWMSVSVLIDMAGNDRYGEGTADIEAPETTADEAFDVANGFTQGLGLFGVGVLADDRGDDVYRASVFAQGTGVFGVGVLLDGAGADTYRVAYQGQGVGNFGVGLLVDAAGDDSYGVHTVGQGVGKPEGMGLLLDLDGNDRYVGYYMRNKALPGPGVNNYYGLTKKTANYSDDERGYNLSVCQGVGWGYRAGWTGTDKDWGGGFGALIDLGAGHDVHYAEVMAMGQGLMYGFGFLYDGGGDDEYRAVWWGPAGGVHMGMGLFLDEAGNDVVAPILHGGGHASDYGVAWTIDNGGDDRYGGVMEYGEAASNGESFFINVGGDDVYNADGAREAPGFGVVLDGASRLHSVGVFLDLGGGKDTYRTTIAGVRNNASWSIPPAGTTVNPDTQKGIGLDR